MCITWATVSQITAQFLQLLALPLPLSLAADLHMSLQNINLRLFKMLIYQGSVGTCCNACRFLTLLFDAHYSGMLHEVLLRV